MIRVALPFHLRNLARVGEEVEIEVTGPPTVNAVLDALESEYPVLRGPIRGPNGGRRRPFLRFFACEQDFSHEPTDTPLPEPVVRGVEPFLIVGATAGG